MGKKELEDKLNDEYQDIGVITIGDFTEKEIDVSQIEYIQPVMRKIDGLASDEPIVVAKHRWNETYELIDGYHRLRNKLDNQATYIQAFVLDTYSIKRKNDTLFSFLERLVGKEVVFLESDLIGVGEKRYQIVENEGCGGCSSGWSSITVFPQFLNKAMTFKSVESDGEEDSDEYKLIVNGKHIADVDTGWGNGYYGGDFKINLIV